MHDCVAVILHFRSAAMTTRCIESLASEGINNLVLVDNSEDMGVSLGELKVNIRELGVDTHYIEPGINLGFAAGVNVAIDFIARRMPGIDALLINSDATLAPGTVRHLMHVMESGVPSIAAPFIDGPTGLVSSRTYYRHLSATISPRGPGARGHALLGGACMMVHRSLLKAPLFDEAFFFYGDDIELAFRLSRQGVALVDVSEGTVIHQGSGSSENGSLFYEYHMSRAHLILVSRLGYGAFGRVCLIAGRLLFLSARALLRSIRFRSLRSWRGLAMATLDVLLERRSSLTPPAASGARRAD